MTPKSLIEPARHAGTALLRSQTDGRLVDLTRDGNERAFEAIVQRYRRPLLRYCSRLLSPARAEDAVQQTFLSAHRAIHAGDAELNLRPWLYRIAHNASLNLLRQNGFDHDQVSEEIDGVETPPQAFERGERLRTVVAAVQDLPERQRSAIVLQAVEGRSYEEIATELGVSDGAVRQLLNRARNTLREAAAALTPTGLLTRVASGGEATVAERVAQTIAGAGGSALVAKAGATLVVAGALAGGAAVVGGNRPHPSDRPGGAAVASAPKPTGDTEHADVQLVSRDTSPSGGGGGGSSAVHGRHSAAHRSGARHETTGGSRSDNRGGSSDGRHESGDDHSGSGRSGSSDGHSGSSGDDSSGSGERSGSSGGGSGDSSGSGSDSGSGSGSGSSGSDDSGSGSLDDSVTTAPAPVTSDSGRNRDGGGDDGSDGGSSGTSGSGTSGSTTTSGSGTSGRG